MTVHAPQEFSEGHRRAIQQGRFRNSQGKTGGVQENYHSDKIQHGKAGAPSLAFSESAHRESSDSGQTVQRDVFLQKWKRLD